MYSLLNQLGGVLRFIPVKELVAGLPLICIKVGAPGYKAMGKAHFYDSRIIINTINITSCLHAPPVNINTDDLTFRFLVV